MCLLGTPCGKACFVAAQIEMQVALLLSGFIGVAASAGDIYFKTGVMSETFVRRLFVGIIDAAVAFDTGQECMLCLTVSVEIDENFFPCLQRRHRAASTFPRGLGLGFSFWIGRVDQALFIGMT